MTELTVSMPAYNVEKYIEKAIKSVLMQQDVDFELFVVDDCSKDKTSKLVESIVDERIKFIRNDERIGTFGCHNMVIEKSKAPFIIHTNSDGLIIDKLALKKMLQVIKESTNIGQVNCYYLTIDKNGQISREEVQNTWRNFHNNFNRNTDYRKDILIKGSIVNHLRIFRKEVFDNLGMFNRECKRGEGDIEMAMRILDRYEIKLVPEFLYCRRIKNYKVTKPNIFIAIILLTSRTVIARDLFKSKKARYFSLSSYKINKLYMLGLLRALKINRYLNTIKKTYTNIFKYINKNLSEKFYSFITNRFSWWPVTLISHKKFTKFTSKKIAYYLMWYPVFSQTFIQREIKALKESGVSVNVFAYSVEGIDKLDEYAKSQIKETRYLETLSRSDLSIYKRNFFLKNPFRYFHLFLYTVFHKYEYNKSYKKDKEIFNHAILLSGLLKEKQIDHIHSPWANKYAFIALIASKFLGIKYSVQGRAYDITRSDRAYGLREKFDNANFIVVNSFYNKKIVEKHMGTDSDNKIKLVYNEAVSLEKFEPNTNSFSETNRIRLLCVGRYVEQKGLIQLLHACNIIKQMGYSFQCELVGGEVPTYLNYNTKLKVIHKRLNLKDIVYFSGALPFNEVLKRYTDSDIFVLPCVVGKEYGSRDNIPNAIIEAMAMKLPVISTNIAGIPEIIDNEIDGLLVAPEDENALVDAIIRLINDEHLRKKLGENARKKVEEKFDINKNIKQFAELFSKVA